MDIKEFKKNAMRDALDKVHSWKQEHQDDYSRFSLDMMKMMRNDFSQLERIFKMAAKYVPTSVLIECQKLLTPNTDTILSDDEKTAVAALEECGYKCKTAIVMLLCSVSAGEAEALLGRSNGRVADAIR